MKEDERKEPGLIVFDAFAINSDASGDIEMTKITGGGFAYQSGGLEGEIADQARHHGFMRVHKLVDAMAECAGWDEALPRVYRHLCCHKLPGAPEATQGGDRKRIWYAIMKILMSDTQFNWLDVDPSVTPPAGLQPYDYIDGRFVPGERKTGYDFIHQLIKLDEFRLYLGDMATALQIPIPVPKDLFPGNRREMDIAADDKAISRGRELISKVKNLYSLTFKENKPLKTATVENLKQTALDVIEDDPSRFSPIMKSQLYDDDLYNTDPGKAKLEFCGKLLKKLVEAEGYEVRNYKTLYELVIIPTTKNK